MFVVDFVPSVWCRTETSPIAMAAHGFQARTEGLFYERQKLSALVLDPLQKIKDYMARNLRLEEVDLIVGCLGHAIRSDTLKTVTDGEALIAVLNLYYGKDNLRVLERLLKKIDCYDLLEILNEWNVTYNPVEARVLRECGYFPLWIRIKNDFAWFVGNKRRILQALRSLFRIPEITPGDPDYETVIYMGVSFGKTDLLIYVLAPLCTRNYIHNSLGMNDVRLALEQLGITGIYFTRHSETNGSREGLSAASFTSIDDSLLENMKFSAKHISPLSDSVVGAESNRLGSYAGQASDGHFHSADIAQASQEGKRNGFKVVRTSIGYVDSPSLISKSSPSSRPAEPIKVVRPKMMYFESSRVPATDILDSSSIGQGSGFMVEHLGQRPNHHMMEQSQADYLDENSNCNPIKWTGDGRSHVSEYRMSDFEFSEGGSYQVDGKAQPLHSSPKSGSKELFISSAALEGKKGNHHKLSVNSKVREYDVKKQVGARHFSTQNGKNSYWYEDGALEDYNKEMIPEPEPGDIPLHFNQNGDFVQGEMMPEEEAAMAKHSKAVNGFGPSPYSSPPQDFHDAFRNGGSKLVKVKTSFVEKPLQQPMLLSSSGKHRSAHGWETQRSQEYNSSTGNTKRDFPTRSSDHWSTSYNHKSVEPVFIHRRPFLMNTETKLESEYEDSVFTDSESQRDVTLSRVAVGPPPYLPPPEYSRTSKQSPGQLSDDSVSTDTLDRSYKSTLLSAASVSSICRQKEMFLSREELQMSIRGAEHKEIERKNELCKELMIAAKAGDTEELERSIDEGVDVDHQNEFGQSALMLASWEGHLGIVEILLNADADPDLQEGFGKSALHEAALGGHHTIVHRLISGGAKIDLMDEEHRTPLHYAAMRGKRRIVEVLLLFGANVTARTKFGESAVELAYSYHHDDIVDLLMTSRDKKIRKEMESQIRKQRLRQLSSTTSLPNLSKVSSMKDLSRSKSRPDLRKKKSTCPIQ